MGVLITSLLKVLYGGVMNRLVHGVMIGPESPEQKTAKVWKELQAEYDAKDVPKNARFGLMKLSMFTPKGLTLF